MAKPWATVKPLLGRPALVPDKRKPARSPRSSGYPACSGGEARSPDLTIMSRAAPGRWNRPPIGGMRDRIAPNQAVSAVSIIPVRWPCVPLFARGMRFPMMLSVWGSNPPVSASGSPVTQGSCRGSPHKPRKSPQDLLKSDHQTAGTGEF